MDKINVLLAEDHTLVREGIQSLLENEDSIQIVAAVKNGLEALQKTRELNPDIVLMDLTMKPMGGLQATQKIHQEFPSTKVLILSIHKDQAYIDKARDAGASGYLFKQAKVGELIKCLKKIHFEDEPPCECFENQSPPIDSHIFKGIPLTTREIQILKLTAMGYTINQTAKCLGISPKTVESHRTKIMKKLNIHSIAGLTRYAIQKGLIDLDYEDQKDPSEDEVD